MARPRSFDVEAFLDQSLEVFWRRGFAATSMADIYEATGLGASSIYAYVKDKNDLFRCVFKRYIDGFRAMTPTDVTGAAAIDRWLVHFAGSLADDPMRKGCLIGNTIVERSAHTPETLAVANELVEEVGTWFRLQIESAKAQGEFRAEVDPAAAASSLLATTLGMMAMARAEASRETLLQIAANATGAFKS